MLTIALIAQKGGTGKTTLTINLAAAALEKGLTPLIIDIDPQASACDWSDWRNRKNEPPYVMNALPARLKSAIETAKGMGVDMIFVDTPAKSGEAGLAAARLADRVIIPCRPQKLDIETLKSVKDIVRLADQPPAVVVLNGVPHLSFARQQEARRDIAEKGFEVCQQAVAHLAAFGDATKAGLSVIEYQSQGRAAQEIRELYLQVYRFTGKQEKINDEYRSQRVS